MGSVAGVDHTTLPESWTEGRSPTDANETMLRVYFLQNWYALSDPMAEETLYDSEAMRRFAGIELGDDRIPPSR